MGFKEKLRMGFASAKSGVKSSIDNYSESQRERRQAYAQSKRRGEMDRARYEGYRAGRGPVGKHKKSSGFDGDFFGFGDMLGTPKKKKAKKSSSGGKNVHIHIHK